MNKLETKVKILEIIYPSALPCIKDSTIDSILEKVHYIYKHLNEK